MNNCPEDYLPFIQLLREELVPATGCTEPIAVAYAAACARDVLGREPDRLEVACSGNVIKNVKSVVVPNTGGLRGIEAAALAGALGGDAGKKLEVLSALTPDAIRRTEEGIKEGRCKVGVLDTTSQLHIRVRAVQGEDWAQVEIRDSHTGIVSIERNGEVLSAAVPKEVSESDRSWLSIENILEFASGVDLSLVADLLEQQVHCNMEIAEEGMRSNYGARVGQTLLPGEGSNPLELTVKAMAAAASDARMGGCPKPVVINSGSGNQGITASVPVIAYARQTGASEEQLHRALLVSNLIAIHQKTGIGKLSAYCGAVSAACGSGAAITYLQGGDLRQIQQTVTNTLANVSGILCDGAKASCAAKIAVSVDAALLGHRMAMADRGFASGEGIVAADAEQTIANVGRIARDGMRRTDEEILKIMTGS